MFCRSSFDAMEQNLGAQERDIMHVSSFANKTPSIANPKNCYLCILESFSPGFFCLHVGFSRFHHAVLSPSLWMGNARYGAQASVSETPPGKIGALLLTDHKSDPGDTSAEDSSLHTYTEPSADVWNNDYIIIQ